MALPLEKLGMTYPPRTIAIDADRSRRYAAATHGESGGPGKPAHDFPDEARSRKVGEHTVHVTEAYGAGASIAPTVEGARSTCSRPPARVPWS